MHRCLEIQEIVSLVCQQLSAENTRTVSNNGSLAALAMTCRDFQEPALDALWYQQTSLIPLVKCFPSDSWELRDEDGVATLVSMSIIYCIMLDDKHICISAVFPQSAFTE